MSRPWMPLYVADYLADTGHLSTLEHGAYLLLIMHYWQNGSLPDDEAKIARIARMSGKEWARVRDTMAELFNDDWSHNRIDAELAKVEALVERRSAAGKAGAAAKRSKRRTNVKQTLTGEQARAGGSPSPSPTQSPEAPSGASSRDAACRFIEVFDEERRRAFGDNQARPWPSPQDLPVARRWLASGADETLVRGVFCARMAAMASRSQAPPDSLGYFDKPVANALAAGKAPMPEGRAPAQSMSDMIAAASQDIGHGD